jgi:shikimate dehydrogenase
LSSLCHYGLYELSDIGQVEEFVRQTPNLVGFNVTIPYKQQIIPYLNSLSEEAREIGAVNCVKIMADGELKGYNTDVDGVRLTLDKLIGSADVGGALVLGSGGASQAVKYVLKERNIPYLIVSRDRAKGDITYAELTHEVISDNRLIINTSPVGMYPHIDDAPSLPYQALSSSHFLFDLVYNPEQTKFMKLGSEAGAHVTSGLDMLYAQAESAWQIWNK